MAKGRRALSRSASLGSFGKSFWCQSGVMWITELARNTITAENRIGSHSDSRLIMEAPLYSYGLMVRRPRRASERRRRVRTLTKVRRLTNCRRLRPASGEARADARSGLRRPPGRGIPQGLDAGASCCLESANVDRLGN